MLTVVQVVNSTVGDIADDAAGVQSNSPIAAPPEVEVVDETKFVNLNFLLSFVSSAILNAVE